MRCLACGAEYAYGELKAQIAAPAARSAPAESEPVPRAKANGHAGVRGVARILPALETQLRRDDYLFVFVHAADGPPMPLAVLRRKASELPLEFTLDDSMAMAQGLSVSAFPKVVIGARVSKSGTATAQPGDLQGKSAPVANDARGVTVTIDSVVR
jgi:cytochrome c-type biogenesis protein CcmH